MAETVGNKRPPIATRFKKGKSGNPKGRPKGSLNLKTDLLAELAETIVINDDGTQRRITKQRAWVKATVLRAIRGESRASNTLVGLINRFAPVELAEPPREAPRSDVDQAILDTYVKSQSAKAKSE